MSQRRATKYRPLLLRSVIRLQCQALRRDSSNAIITSPYLTSDTAETVIASADPESCIVLTTFSAETFATGGSSLRTVRRLVERGFTLHALDGLHAKILVAGKEMFVGSQNLTARGRTNREATVRLIDDPPAVNELRQQIEQWIKDAREITIEMIIDMEQAIRALELLAREFQKQAGLLDQEIARNEKRRRQDWQAQFEARLKRNEDSRRKAQLRREEERQRAAKQRRDVEIEAARQASAALRRAVDASPTARESVLLTLREVPMPSPDQFSKRTYWTLIAPSQVDMSQLGFGEDAAELRFERRIRYLLIVPEIGRLGWPALNRTRFTRFGFQLNRTGLIVNVGERPCNVSIRLNADITTLSRWNVRFRLYGHSLQRGLVITARFSLEGFEFEDLSDDPSDWLNRKKVETALHDPNESLASSLRSALLKPFQYDRNRSGVLASEFCEGLGDRFILRWRRYTDHPYFTMERYD